MLVLLLSCALSPPATAETEPIGWVGVRVEGALQTLAVRPTGFQDAGAGVVVVRGGHLWRLDVLELVLPELDVNRRELRVWPEGTARPVLALEDGWESGWYEENRIELLYADAWYVGTAESGSSFHGGAHPWNRDTLAVRPLDTARGRVSAPLAIDGVLDDASQAALLTGWNPDVPDSGDDLRECYEPSVISWALIRRRGAWAPKGAAVSKMHMCPAEAFPFTLDVDLSPLVGAQQPVDWSALASGHPGLTDALATSAGTVLVYRNRVELERDGAVIDTRELNRPAIVSWETLGAVEDQITTVGLRTAQGLTQVVLAPSGLTQRPLSLNLGRNSLDAAALQVGVAPGETLTYLDPWRATVQTDGDLHTHERFLSGPFQLEIQDLLPGADAALQAATCDDVDLRAWGLVHARGQWQLQGRGLRCDTGVVELSVDLEPMVGAQQSVDWPALVAANPGLVDAVETPQGTLLVFPDRVVLVRGQVQVGHVALPAPHIVSVQALP
jgi:hypothetical protein